MNVMDRFRLWLVTKPTRVRINEFVQRRSSNGLTLDIGAGVSRYSHCFPNRVALELPSAKSVVDVFGDAHKLPFSDATFDLVLATEVLEHLTHPAIAVDEMRRVLKPRGELILTTRFFAPIHNAPGDFFRYTPYGLRILLKEWTRVEIEAEALPGETMGILLQRIPFQASLRGGKLTALLIALLAKCARGLDWLIDEGYGDITKTYPEQNFVSSGFHVHAIR